MLKRAFDIAASGLLIVMLSPVLAAIGFLVAVRMGRPVLFVHERPGLNGRPFRMIKFRSMRDPGDLHGNLLTTSERITPLGRFLRASSLDELPELWNVLKGEMSLVGPRPLLMEYLPLYSTEQRRRHEVRPGITGWAQVNGRNSITWEEKFAHDIWYVDHQGFLLDLKILVLTIRRVVKREGINASEQATMPRFAGTQKNE